MVARRRGPARGGQVEQVDGGAAGGVTAAVVAADGDRAGVAHQALDDDHVGAAVEQVGGEGAAQVVWGYRLAEATAGAAG